MHCVKFDQLAFRPLGHTIGDIAEWCCQAGLFGYLRASILIFVVLKFLKFITRYLETVLLPDSILFLCFRKFFQRIILCNSLVWTCAFTGRPNMTFSEALHSEKRAQEQLNNFPTYLQSPLLYLAHLTHRSRLNDVVDDVFMFSKDRYFIGESVFVTVSNERLKFFILSVQENLLYNVLCYNVHKFWYDLVINTGIHLQNVTSL